MSTPAEDRAASQGLPTVAVTNFDLGRILTGNPMIVTTLDGNEVLLRLFTADELLNAVERAGDKLAEMGWERGPGMNRARAVELTTPLVSRS